MKRSCLFRNAWVRSAVIVLPALISLGVVFSLSSLPRSPELPVPGDPDYVNALWLAAEGELIKLGLPELEPVLHLAFPVPVRTVGLDSHSGLVWIYSGEELKAFDFRGRLVASAPVPPAAEEEEEESDSEDSEGDTHAQLLADSATGTVWLAVRSSLFQFDSEGQLLDFLTLPERVKGVGLDESSARLWVATRTLLLAYNNAGSLEQFLDLGRGAQVQDISVDPHTGEIWVAERDRLFRLDPSGDLGLEVPFRRLSNVVVDYEGGAWLFVDRRLVRVDAWGSVLFILDEKPRPLEKPVRLLSHPLDHSLWLIGKRGLVQISPEGEILERGMVAGSEKDGVIRSAAIYVDTIPPEIAIVSPLEGTLLNDASPDIEVRYSDLGRGVDPGSILFELDGLTYRLVATRALRKRFVLQIGASRRVRSALLQA